MGLSGAMSTPRAAVPDGDASSTRKLRSSWDVSVRDLMGSCDATDWGIRN